jgi:DNA-binding Xre family transcriptional regulator
MAKIVKIKVPDIMAKRNISYIDLHYGARIARATAERWTDPELAKEITRVDFETLIGIAQFLNCKIEDLLEIVDDIS